MKQTRTNIHLLTALLFLSHFALGQTLVWPGDINNNGVVSASDLLNYGKAFGNNGAERENATTNWSAQLVNDTWGTVFPGGTDYSFADANGDGIVDESDMLGGILGNFGKSHGTLFSEGYLNGVGGIDPTMGVNSLTPVATFNSTIEVELSLGDGLFPVDEFYGVSFLVSFSEDIIDLEQGIGFELSDGSWVDPSGVNHRKLAMPQEDGKVQFAITRVDQLPINDGSGVIGHFFIIVEDFVDLMPADTLFINVDSVKLIDNSFNVIPIATSETAVALVNNLAFDPSTGTCPDVVAPVCGSDGNTYLNSCYALEAGITDYTIGVCYSDCIDYTLMDPNANCPYNYDPVCGCNNITYNNSCMAEAAGITEYSTGPCNTLSCIDYSQILNSDSVNVEDGYVKVACEEYFDPVCGCDGITYTNECWAEASGVTFYTAGACGTCVDPWLINPDTLCTYVYEPVCGCNNVTYINECHATAAGVTSFTSGTCGNSVWCNEAIPIQCGDFLANETTVGAGNQISNYTNCLNTSLVGPDKVYVINKNTPGDLQIGLEIITPGLDLDLFLLADYCSTLQCIDGSHTNNSQTNNEGILYEDAPIGTYYIVVDGQYANSEGVYHLEVSCAYLDCSDAQTINCGQTFSYNNIYGNDDVSSYQCGNVLNVENNGPEVVHAFTVTEPGQVNISLTGLSANLELFLLASCDNGNCLKYSQNGGNSNEYITTYLGPGTYYAVVDGYNGATSDYDLLVECGAGCSLNVWTSTNDADCGSNNGSISITTNNGSAPYWISWSGPVSGNTSTYQPSAIIPSLPSGTYTVQVTDVNGCSDTKIATIDDAGNLNFWADPLDGSCSTAGGIQVNISSGTPGYNIYLSGPVSQNVYTVNSSYTFDNLPSGTYTVYLQDANGCAGSQQVTITEGNGGLSFNMTPHAASCGQLGYISVVAFGQAPYFVYVTGPVNGGGIAQTNNFSIQNLPGGTYTVTIEDSNWCQSSQTITVPSFMLDISATVQNGVCGGEGSVTVSMNSGTPNYTISWTGPVNNSITTSNSSYSILNLPGGTYTINVTDSEGCTDYQVVTVDNSSPGLDVDISTLDASCNETGFIWMGMNNGTAPFTITWSGPVSGSTSIDEYFYDITDVPGGYYTVTVTDIYGCTFTTSVNVNGGSGLNFNLQPGSANCGQNGEIDISILTGDAPFYISWSGPSTGWISINSNSYTISNLPSGNYNVTITDANSCSQSESIYLNTTNSLNFTATPNDGDCGENGSVSINVSGGSSNYTISWSGPTFGSFNTTGNSFIIPNLPSGYYTIDISDSQGCAATQNVSLSNGGSSLSVGYSPIGGDCGENGSIILAFNNGNAPFDIQWNGPSAGNASTSNISYTIPGLSSGMYFITVTDENGCQDEQGLWLVNDNDLNFTADPDNGNCNQFGTIALNIAGGTAPFNITYSGPSSGNVTSATSFFTLTNLLAGNYTITISDSGGCSSSQTVWLSNGENVEFWATPDNGDCGELGSIFLEIGAGTPPYSISWSGLSSGSTTVSGSTYTIWDLPSDAYNILITDVNGCGDNQTVYVNNGTDLNLIATPNEGVCGGFGSISLSFNGGSPPYQIYWNGPISSSGQTSGTNFTIPNLIEGSYQISISDNSGCSSNQTVWLDTSTGIELNTSTTGGDCGTYGSINLTYTNGQGPYIIAWQGTANGQTSTTNSSYSITNLNSGNYSVTVTDSNGCTDTEAVWLNNGTDVDLTAYPVGGSCGQLGSIELNFSGGNNFTISWSGTSSGSASSSGNSFTISNLISGNYSITVTNSSGCTDTETVWLTNSGSIAFNASANNGYCGQNGSIDLSFTGGSGPYQISWSGTSNGSTSVNGNFYNIPNLVAGNYTVSIEDNNGCTESEVVWLSTGNNVNFSATPMNGSCGTYGSISLNITNGNAPFTINWSGPNSGSFTTTNNSYNIQNLPSGSYAVSITDANNCNFSQSIWLENGTNLSFNAVGNNGACGQYGSIYLTIANGTPPFQVSWSGNANGSMNITTNTYTIPTLPAGTYTINISDGGNCSGSSTATVISSPSPSVSIDATTVLCNGNNDGTATAYASGGTAPYSYAWSNGQFGQTINNLGPGNYSVITTDALGCTATSSVVITQASILTTDVASSNITCYGAQDGSILVTGWGGTPLYTYVWSTGFTETETSPNAGSLLNNLSAGVYAVTVTDQMGCSVVEQIAVSEPSPIVLSVSSTAAGCNQATGSATVSPSGGTPPYTYNWSIGGTNSTITDIGPGTYTVQVFDANFCVETALVTVGNDGAAPVAAWTYYADALTVNFTSNASGGGSVLWDFGDGNTSTSANPSHTYCEEGTYYVCQTVTNGCGTDTYCEFLTFTIPADYVTLDIGEISAASGTTALVPVTVHNLDILVSLAGSFELSNPDATIIDLAEGAIFPTYNSNNNTFSFFESSGNGVAVTEGEVLFYIQIQLTGAPGTETNITITDYPLSIEVGGMINGQGTVLPHAILCGSLSIPTVAYVSGWIHTWWGEGINWVTVDAQSPGYTGSYFTNESGEYHFDNIPWGETYIIEPTKDTLHDNGLSTFALFVGQQYILGKNPPQIVSPYQVIAGDANCNGSFTTLDLFAIQQVLIGSADEFASCPSWVFIPEHHDMPEPFDMYNVFPFPQKDTMQIMSDTIADFIGIKMGDILGQANPNLLIESDDRNREDLVLFTSDQSIQAGEVVDIRLSSTQFSHIASLQFALGYDKHALQLIDFHSANLHSPATGLLEDEIRLSWFESSSEGLSLTKEEKVFTLRFQALRDIESLEGLFEFKNNPLQSVAHQVDGNAFNLVLEFEEEVEIVQPILLQNTPNPFSDKTLVQFELPKAEEATLFIRDSRGKVVQRIQNNYKKGFNEVTVEKAQLSSGVYYYTLKTDNHTITKRMVIL